MGPNEKHYMSILLLIYLLHLMNNIAHLLDLNPQYILSKLQNLFL